MSVRTARAKLAAASRHHPEQVDDLRRELVTAALAAHVAKALATAPPLTPEQKRSIARLLVGGDAA